MYDEFDPDEVDDTAGRIATELLECEHCEREHDGPFTRQEDHTKAGYSLEIHFECEHCGFTNCNTAILAADGGYNVDHDPDDPRSIVSCLDNVVDQLERGLEDVPVDDEWTCQAVASILTDVRDLRAMLEDDTPDVATDGGRVQGRRAYRGDIHSVQTEAGVGDQAPGGGCPHSDDGLPCFECFIDQDGDRR